MYLKQKKWTQNVSIEYEDVLYFDLQPHPIACTLGSDGMCPGVSSYGMEADQGSYIWKMNAFWWLTDVI